MTTCRSQDTAAQPRIELFWSTSPTCVLLVVVPVMMESVNNVHMASDCINVSISLSINISVAVRRHSDCSARRLCDSKKLY